MTSRNNFKLKIDKLSSVLAIGRHRTCNPAVTISYLIFKNRYDLWSQIRSGILSPKCISLCFLLQNQIHITFDVR